MLQLWAWSNCQSLTSGEENRCIGYLLYLQTFQIHSRQMNGVARIDAPNVLNILPSSPSKEEEARKRLSNPTERRPSRCTREP